MSIVAWIVIGLIPGFLAVVLAARRKQTVRVRSVDSERRHQQAVVSCSTGTRFVGDLASNDD